MEDEVSETISRIRRANAAYARASAGRPTLSNRPTLQLAVITCMDGRINVHEALGLSDGEAHIIRNAGGIVTEDALRSLVVSQWALGTAEIVIIQHTGCGMMGLGENDLRTRIAQETGATLPFQLGGFVDLESSVRGSVQRARECQLLRQRERVSGFIFDLESRILREVDSGASPPK